MLDFSDPKKKILNLRSSHLSPSLSVAYGDVNPLLIVKGDKQYLYDEKGTAYLDCVNNVCHVGHCHPTVVKATNEQLSKLNTNTRYLHPNIAMYAKKLTSTFPEPLKHVIFVNSGTEANELAIRMAQAYHNHNKKDILSVEHGYHGHSTTLVSISSYKLQDQPRQPLPIPESTHILPMPDMFRGKYNMRNCKSEEEICDHYINELKTFLERSRQRDKIGTFILESINGCGGQVVYPKNYLLRGF
ncbi:alanine-glyoxylate aminotransferase [Reticulomyxa filosa]|uniref:Alanine-glyoxylate aminotransferase n=1 Tax=Reticulomyxa filosa TaxID=46433 RepID=X6P434_RETFI|nr:alanine-glyoxylate aminotransferase [Reticulomyxa filosa]|eukprot:ETO32849.1 alanine-glyoxylate aminotransferase [Reticulomyxa filosa]